MCIDINEARPKRTTYSYLLFLQIQNFLNDSRFFLHLAQNGIIIYLVCWKDKPNFPVPTSVSDYFQDILRNNWKSQRNLSGKIIRCLIIFFVLRLIKKQRNMKAWNIRAPIHCESAIGVNMPRPALQAIVIGMNHALWAYVVFQRFCLPWPTSLLCMCS